jgi:hypothetical protein
MKVSLRNASIITLSAAAKTSHPNLRCERAAASIKGGPVFLENHPRASATSDCEADPSSRTPNSSISPANSLPGQEPSAHVRAPVPKLRLGTGQPASAMIRHQPLRRLAVGMPPTNPRHANPAATPANRRPSFRLPRSGLVPAADSRR